ncbi:ATP-binding protein [Jiulongibacter sp. NS-SX5]|uniref:ATP-binding protein n=1 Tax=Jiulongibacter sp. NS-SX5 TaxID=3463854 RepID=UPI004058A4ED
MLKRILYLILVFSSFSALAEEIPLKKGLTKPLNITKDVEYYVDESGSSSVDQIVDKEFRKINDQYFLIPFSDKSFWFKVDLTSRETNNEEWVLNFSNQLTENLEIYRQDSLSGKYKHVGTWTINSSRSESLKGQEPYFNFSPRESETILFRIQNKRGMRTEFYIYPASISQDVLLDYASERQLINGLLIFRLFLIVTLSLFVIKDIGFRGYSFLVIIKTLGYWGLINVLNPSFADTIELGGQINFLLYASSPVGVITFSLLVLPLKDLPKWVKNGFYLFLGLTVIAHILVWTEYDWHYVYFGILIVVLSSLYTLGIFALAVLRKLPIQYFYSVPFLVGIGSYLLLNVQILLGIKIPLILILTFFFFTAEILIFIFFLGRIFYQYDLKGRLADQELENERIQSEKLKEIDNLKTSFFTNISHEIKTPLTLISGPLQELRKRNPSEKLLNIMEANVIRLGELVGQILDIQKLESGKERPNIIKADIARQIRLQVMSFESLATSKRIRLNLQQTNDSFEAYFDDDKLNKIVTNLLTNAIKYSSEEGEVSVTVQFENHPKKVLISVADSGQGIEEADIEHIFEKFYQVNSQNHQGSGVGLSLVKELTDLLKGSVRVVSNKGIGTTFMVELPADEDTWRDYINHNTEPTDNFVIRKSSDQPITPTILDQDPNEKKKLILLVEDNPDMQEYLSEILSHEFNLLRAFDGKEGIALASSEVPDLIITDLMMPVMDGLEFSSKIRENTASSHVPIIMLTAKSNKETKLKSLEMGIDHFLTKPFDTDELNGVVNNCLENRAILRKVFSQNVGESITQLKGEINPWEKAFMDNLQDFLENLYHDSSLTVPTIAAHLNMSESQFRRKLKSISTFSPNEYLRKFRLHKAAEKLKNSSKTVSETAFEVGFENLSYFSKIYQEEFGKSPSEASKS